LKKAAILILFAVIAAPVFADTHAAASCSYAHVTAAIAAASAGDTVTVPAGSATWDATLLITVGINLIGAGIGNTIITNNSGGGLGYNSEFWIQYNPADYDLNTPFRISGFTWDLNADSSWLMLGAVGKGAPFTVQTKVRIDHNRVINPTADDGAFIWNGCDFYGVVDNNEVIGSGFPIVHDAGSAEANWWGTSPQNICVPGSSNYLYFEDNLFELNSATDNALCDAQYNARYVMRYNTITGMKSYGTFAVHGHQDSGSMGSCFGVEIYGNQITTADSGGYRLYGTRGGFGYVFCNNITGAGTYTLAFGGSLVTCASVSPELQIIHDNYSFNNRKNLTGALMGDEAGGTPYTCAGQDDNPLAGRDYITPSTTPGVTVGTLGSLPGTCATNQGYWATAQSASDLTGMVGINPSTPIAGTLYKATATNTWTAYYTPYTYPHPLRLAEGTQTQGVVQPGAKIRVEAGAVVIIK
jgi:hypothetical protein